MRTPIEEIECKTIDNQLVKTEYKAGYSTYIVNSVFSGGESIDELFYKIIQRKELQIFT